jgi:uncharacterized phage-associated protein
MWGWGRASAEAVMSSPAPGNFLPIRFRYNPDKAAEAAGELLRHAGGAMPYMRLVQLLYLADREALHRFGHPIVGGRYVGMKYGPVIGEVLDAIRAEAPPPAWKATVEPVEGSPYDVRVRHGEFPIQFLSQAELDLLGETWQLWRTFDQWALLNVAHALGEWRDPGDSCFDITPENILHALKRPDEAIEDIREAAIEENHFRRLFAGR